MICAGWLSHPGNFSRQVITTKHTMSVTYVSQPPHCQRGSIL